METKICSKCGEEKELDGFCKNKYQKDGYNYICKLCQKKAYREWYDANIDHRKAYDKAYAKANPNLEIKRKNQRIWAKNHPEKKKEKDRIRHQEGKEKCKDFYIKRILKQNGFPKEAITE